MAEDSSQLGVNHVLLARALSALDEPVLVADPNGRVLWINDAFARVTGYAPRDVHGGTPSILKSGVQDDAFYRALWDTIRAGAVWRGVLVNRRRDGSLYEVEEVITPICEEGCEPTHFVAIQHDVTARRRADRRREFQALHDALTGLANRTLFVDLLQQSMAVDPGHSAAVAFVDLDGFKAINDRCGHLVGDRLLVAVARRMRACVRAGDVVARLGGDEFGVLMRGLTAEVDPVHGVAEGIVRALGRPFVVYRDQLQIGASVGVAVWPADGRSPRVLLGRADASMYRVKAAGGGGWALHGGPVRRVPRLPHGSSPR